MASKTTKNSGGNERSIPAAKPAVIPVIQERAVVKKRVVETGRVRIRKHVREYEEHVDIPHIHEEIHVDHVPIDRVIESAPDIRTEGEVTIIPVVEERYVLQKQLVLVEELHVRRERHETHRPEVVKVLKEEVEVERLPPGGHQQTGGSGRKAKAAKSR